MLQHVLCLLGHHRRGGPVRHAGRYYKSHCKGCHCRIVRRSGGGRWRDPSDLDADKIRRPLALGRASGLSVGLSDLGL